MTQFNLVGVQREVEALFNRHDDYLSGNLDYKEFSLVLYGLSTTSISLNKESRAVIYKMKAKIVSIGGASGLINLIQDLKRVDGYRSGTNNKACMHLCYFDSFYFILVFFVL